MLLFAPHPAAFPAGGKHRPGQSVSPGSPGQARLSRLLPPDVELYLLRLPGRRIRENDVRRELASRYPGGSVDFDVKILARERDEKRQPWLRAAVFAAKSEAAALYRRDRRPLIPGAALLSAAFRIRFPGKAGLRPALIILLSGGRLEAALFERGIMEAHLALNRQGPEEDGALPTLLEEFASRAGDGLEAAVVLDGETDRRAEALAARFKGCSVLSINKCYRAVRVRRDRIFGAAPGGPAGSSALPFLAAALLAVLFPVLRVSAGRLEAVEAALLEAAREEARRGERAEALAAEIKSLEVPETGSRPGADSAAPAGAPGNAGVYGIIAGLCRVLPDCRIRSLSIRGGRFSLEAEGQDSLAAAAALADSPLFSGITLSGTSPAEGRGEVFTLSGALRHGE